MRYLFLLALLYWVCPAPAQDTFSIVAVDSTTGEVGSAGASCIDLYRFLFLTPDQIGEVYPGRGAINTQSYYLEQNQRNAATRLLAGDSPTEVIRWIATNDVEGRPGRRQYGVAALRDSQPAAAAYTGATSADYKGQLVGPNYAIQGNILLGPEVLEDMEARFLTTEGDLACKLMAAMQGAKRVGADVRCTPFGTSSLFAYLKVAQPSDAFGMPSLSISVRLRETEPVEPIDTLQRLFDAAYVCGTTAIAGSIPLGNDRVRLYPNPTTDQLYLALLGAGPAVLELYDLVGRRVLQEVVREAGGVGVGRLPAGSYLARVRYGGRVVGLRVVISHR